MESDENKKKIWFCKIGEIDGSKLPRGCDGPMRDAVARAYKEITGEERKFTFSGWGAELTRGERAVVDNTIPEPEPEDEALESIRAERDSYLDLLNGADPEGNEDSYPVLKRLKEAEERIAALEAAITELLALRRRMGDRERLARTLCMRQYLNNLPAEINFDLMPYGKKLVWYEEADAIIKYLEGTDGEQ